ncbi:MAG TPA: adenylate/guanylate cyclase domain-containing protein [Kofleriaceae bacterium]|nr:adenylate/guanylate cyclase domain-containing protein [Kofleriaceae bacterium]
MPTGLSAKTRSLLSGVGVGMIVGIVAAGFAIARPAVLERPEAATYDQRARAVMNAAHASKDIVLIDIDEADIEDAENNFDVLWPWPRSLYGDITTYCKKAGAKAIVFDWLFQDRGGMGVADDEAFASAAKEAGNAVFGLALTKDKLVDRPLEGPYAAKLAAYETRDEARSVALRLAAWNVRSFVLQRVGKFELWYGGKKTQEDVEKTWKRLSSADDLKSLFEPESPPPAGGDGQEAPPAEPKPPQIVKLDQNELSQELTVVSIIRDRDGIPLAGKFPRREGLDPPLAVIAAAPARLGNVYQNPEADGIMRRHAPLVLNGNVAYPSLSLAAYLVGHPDVTPKIDGHTLELGERKIQLDDDGQITMHFHGAHVYPHLSAYEVLRSSVMIDEGTKPSVPFEQLKDKYVIVSATGQALRDLRATPISTRHLGAEVQATALDNMLRGDVVRRTSPWVDGAIALFVCVAMSLLMIVLWRVIRKPGLALIATAVVTTGVLVGYYFIARAALGSGNLWVAYAAPSIGGGVSAFATLLALSAVERSGKRFVQEALGRYTSTELVRQLMEHPEYLSLEWGESREMSVYFSDIQGFTTISEGLKPEVLVALLNEYLTTMTDLVLSHGGVVDKYIGDAIMAFWGAPLPAKDHAERAVKCAIAMRKKCDELRATWQERYGHEVYARAGVNSGSAVVGNMGSKHKYNYTVMGDMVNLASRLEGANKAYDTFLMVSESTVERLGGKFDVRELDRIAVKGKDKPVTVYEILDEVGKTDPAWVARARKFEDGLALYRAKDFVGARKVFEANEVDPPSAIYAERCTLFEAEPPAADWDGVWRMKEK